MTYRLSNKIKRINTHDKMLFAFGVHRIHLGRGEKVHDDPLLFAFVTRECLYAINIYQHRQWTQKGIVEIIYRNWPDIIEQYKIKGAIGLSHDVTDEERNVLRKKNVNAAIQLSNGTIYLSLGGGVASSGNGIESAIRIDVQHKWLKYVQ